MVDIFSPKSRQEGGRKADSAVHYLLHLGAHHQLCRVPTLPLPLSFLMVNYANGKNERQKEEGPYTNDVRTNFGFLTALA